MAAARLLDGLFDVLTFIGSDGGRLAVVGPVLAVLSLFEEGRLSLGDPVSRFIPAFGNTTVSIRGENGITVVPSEWRRSWRRIDRD